MSFVLSLFLAVFVTVTGTYLLSRAKIATTVAELLSIGFFFGFGLFSLFYLGLCRFLPANLADLLIILLGCISLVLLVRDLRRQRLQMWFDCPRWHIAAIIAAGIFMLLIAFAALTGVIDDDFLLHFPSIKRIQMGDVPPHLYYFPDVLLRGHMARDLFVGFVAKGLNLTPELAIIYTTIAACPFYLLAFYALARRLAQREQLATGLCFIGLLFLVSFDLGGFAIRAGCITYQTNNNLFAYAHAIMFGWLIERAACAFVDSNLSAKALWNRNKPLIVVCVLAYASMYFVYLSNFLMFSLFLVTLPTLTLLGKNAFRPRAFMQSALLVFVTVTLAFTTHVVVSPLLVERLQVTLSLRKVREPMAVVQQARFQFPKPKLFTITDPGGIDRPIFRRKSLLAQGLSFFIGLCGLIVGIFIANKRLFAMSCFGWITMLFMLTTDMGEYRAETLRLMLLAHIAFGGCSGLMLGLAASWLQSRMERSKSQLLSHQASKYAIGIGAAILALWMAVGNWQKCIDMNCFDLAGDWRRFRAIQSKDPEHWFPLLNVPKIDSQVFQLLSKYARGPKDRVLLKMNQDKEFRGDGHPILELAPMVNASSDAGVGIVGVCYQNKDEITMARKLYTNDYRSTLFWQRPTLELLDQLAPNYIVIDPSLTSADVLNTVTDFPGVSRLCTIEDSKGRKRVLLCVKRDVEKPKATVKSIQLKTNVVNAKQNEIIEVGVDVPSNELPKKIGMLVTSPAGTVVNLADIPIVGSVQNSDGTYKLSFAMIQEGTWKVSFIDPSDDHPLHVQPLMVHVSESSSN